MEWHRGTSAEARAIPPTCPSSGPGFATQTTFLMIPSFSLLSTAASSQKWHPAFSPHLSEQESGRCIALGRFRNGKHNETQEPGKPSIPEKNHFVLFPVWRNWYNSEDLWWFMHFEFYSTRRNTVRKIIYCFCTKKCTKNIQCIYFSVSGLFSVSCSMNRFSVWHGKSSIPVSTHDRFITKNTKIEKSFELMWQMLLFSTRSCNHLSEYSLTN